MFIETAHQPGRRGPRAALIPRLLTALCCIAGALFLVRRLFIYDEYPTALSAVLPTLLCTFEALVLLIIGLSVMFRNARSDAPGPA